MKSVPSVKPAKATKFNLETFKAESKAVSYSFDVYESVDELSGLKPEQLLQFVNDGAKRAALLAAKRSVPGVSLKAVRVVAQPYLLLFDHIADKKKRYAEVLALISRDANLVELVKRHAAKLAAEGDEDEDDGEEGE